MVEGNPCDIFLALFLSDALQIAFLIVFVDKNKYGINIAFTKAAESSRSRYRAMNSQLQCIPGGRKKVETQSAQAGAGQEAKNHLSSQVLALTGVLQTTLEINELFALFARELAKFVKFDGLGYQISSLQIDISLGQQTNYSCQYQLVVADEELGEMRLFRFSPFEQTELETVENLLAALIYPLRNTLLYQRAVKTALIDPLTGVKNRATMDNAIRREIELSRRNDSVMSVILLDIDHFKRVNDRFGHLSGDQALRAVAQCAEQTIRESDMLFRYGGEEFLILLSGTDTEGARLLAERIRRNVACLDSNPGTKLRLTISLGVTSLTGEDNPSSLFKRADSALYRAKEEGRNRVIVG